MSEDHCQICADSLDWTGFGACGHKDACSRCVARLRFVLQDKRCMYCQQPQDAVFFTRYMGDYTSKPGNFDALPDRVKKRELYQVEEVDGFFDDKEHYEYIKALCSYTHPSLAQPGRPAPSFKSLDQLKRRMQEVVKLHFCDLCLKGRKVFISEQVLYDKRDLDRHNKTGDDAGPLAESGFKGHPACHFCRRRFYDSSELFTHMERDHEHCFLCRRANPSKYVYFRDYAELDGHFLKDHHPCPHPACLERRFVVFGQEAELKRHFASEHGEEMRMSRAQRREALSVNVDLRFTPRGGGRGGGGGGGDQSAAGPSMERPGIVIGGGAGLARAGGRGSGMRHSRSDPAMTAAVVASVESAGAEAARRSATEGQEQQQQMSSVTFNAADFPAVSGARGANAPGGGVALGTWVAAGNTAGPSTSSGAGLASEDFPELPSLSRSQRQRQRQKAKAAAATLVARMAAAAAPPRVLNRSTPDSRGAGGSSSGGGAAPGMTTSRSTGSLEGAGGSSSIPPVAASDGEDAADAFPALDGGSGATALAQQAHPCWVPVRSRAPRPQGRVSATASASAPGPSDFPALGGGRGSGARQALRPPVPSPAPRPDPVAQAAQQGGVSEQLKAANRALVERIKQQLDTTGFASFREKSAAFMRGDLTADGYHDLVVGLGLLSIVSQLAELCPDPERRDSLLAAHKDFLQSSRAHDAAALGAGWVPPEAALAAARHAEQRASWSCGICTLVNAPMSKACEVCGTQRAAATVAAAAQQNKHQQQQPRQQQQQQQQAQSGRTLAELLATPSRHETEAAAVTKTSGSAGDGRAAAASSSSSAPPPPTSGMSWPSLGGGGDSIRGGGEVSGPSSSADTSFVEEDAATAASQQEEPSGKGKGKKKPVKQTLQQLLQSGRSAPGNAWSQQNRTAELGQAPAAAQPRGSWGAKAGGGEKLARQLRATGLGER